jgi:uncharacterized protein
MTDSSEPDDDDAVELVPVPHDALSATALRGVIESFVLREGTDYGEHDVPLARKIDEVLRQIERGEAGIVFDPRTESIDIRPLSPPRRPHRDSQ